MTAFVQARPFGLQAIDGVLGTIVLTAALLTAATILVAAFLAERRETGRVSALSRWAARVADVRGRPLWEPLPFGIVLTGLALALLGWRPVSAGGPFLSYGIGVAVLGLTLALLGGVLAGALAHPPASVMDRESGPIAHPLPAHHVIGDRGRLGAGPVGAVVIVASSLVALLSMPIASVWRLVAGGSAADSAPAHHLVVAAVGAVCLGAWGLTGEGRAAGPGPHPQPRPRPRLRPDLNEAAAATAVLLALSVAVDSGLPVVAAGTAGAVVLVVARVRGGVGAAGVTGVCYLILRAGVAVLTWSFGAPVAPLAWPCLLAAVMVEALAGLLVVAPGVTRGAGLRGPRSGPGAPDAAGDVRGALRSPAPRGDRAGG